MKGTYTISTVATTVTTAQALIYYINGTGHDVEIVSARAGVVGAVEDNIDASLRHVTNKASVVGATLVPGLMHGGDSVALSAACKGPVTTDPTAMGTAAVRGGGSGGFEWHASEHERITVADDEAIVIYSGTTLTSCSIAASITFRETTDRPSGRKE